MSSVQERRDMLYQVGHESIDLPKLPHREGVRPRPAEWRDWAIAAKPKRTAFDIALLGVCGAVLAAMAPPGFTIQLHLKPSGECPTSHRHTVLRVVSELLGNALEHGFYARSAGRVSIGIVADDNGSVSVSVSDDGWGLGSDPVVNGNGFALLGTLGAVRLTSTDARSPFVTVATVRLPALSRLSSACSCGTLAETDEP